MVPVRGAPIIPTRGSLSISFFRLTTLVDLLVMQFLIFFVFDVILFCLLFVRKLGRSEWPMKTKAAFAQRFKVRPDFLGDWTEQGNREGVPPNIFDMIEPKMLMALS